MPDSEFEDATLNPFAAPQADNSQQINDAICVRCGESAAVGFINSELYYTPKSRLRWWIWFPQRLDGKSWWYSFRILTAKWFLIFRCDSCGMTQLDTSKRYSLNEARRLST